MPQASGTYLLADSQRYAVGYYHGGNHKFVSHHTLDKPTHWAYLPESHQFWQADESLSPWQVIRQQVPNVSGLYLLSDGARQAVSYFNGAKDRFAHVANLDQPSYWMSLPTLPGKRPFI